MKNVWQRILRALSPNQNYKRTTRKLSKLENKLGYKFKKTDLLNLALVHRSYLSVSGERRMHTNERLEFLGDAVLGFIVTEYLFELYPKKNEGFLTEYNSILVSRNTLGRIGRQIDLGMFMYLGQGEERSGGRKRHSIISNAFEAILGAIYQDGGYEAVRAVIERLIFVKLKSILERELDRNYKSQLLESTQASGLGLPEYKIKTEHGPEHEKVFEIVVLVQDKIMGIGTGKSKKKAEQNAAQHALEKMN